MSDRRLIEDWLPLAELSIESTRERTPMTPFPAPNRLHVWWARRPLVASRAAVLASLLPADADRKQFLHCLGIHGNPLKAKQRIEEARRTGVRVTNPYGYDRAFHYSPDGDDWWWLRSETHRFSGRPVVLDPTAGGGSIPLEALRLGCRSIANDLNPVAAFLLRATADFPLRFGAAVRMEFEALAGDWRREIQTRLDGLFPQRDFPDRVDQTYLWARTVLCPYCSGLVPLSPNWRLTPDGFGVRLVPKMKGRQRVCDFEIVESKADQSKGTVEHGDCDCPFPDCGRVIGEKEIKEASSDGGLGEQIFAVVYKERVDYKTKAGKRRWRWVRRFRVPGPDDDKGEMTRVRLAERLPEWDARDVVPSEQYEEMHSDNMRNYGVRTWRDLFSPRQLFCHGTTVEIFHELLDADREAGTLTDIRRAAYGYLAIALDTMLDYNNRCSYWDATTGRGVRHIFNRHDLSFVWSYAEMAPLVSGKGYDWAIEKTAKCIRELTGFVRGENRAKGGLFPDSESKSYPEPEITCEPGGQLDHLEDSSVDAVVMDPPYYDNVMYAELSDFFYVWLRRTAGRVFPDLFRRRLTDKEQEAVANPVQFVGRKGARALAGREYQKRMAGIFREMRRVLKADGVLTLMFTHKATGAWDALATGLLDAGFSVNASWPVSTESEGGLHIKNKAAAKSSVFLVCRPRPLAEEDEDKPFWEDIEPRVAARVRKRVKEFETLRISRVDLYLAAFGPALEEFSRHWPVRRGKPRSEPEEGVRRRAAPGGEKPDPYRATPEDALLVARREVKRSVLERLTRSPGRTELDPLTDFFVLAWEAFRAPVFPYDEALKLARAAGLDLEREVVGRLAEKKGQNLHLWDSVRRAGKNRIGPADGSRAALDRLHHGANLAREQTLTAAKELYEQVPPEDEAAFRAALDAALEVLPLPATRTGAALKGEIESASNDFEALFELGQLLYGKKFEEPKQLSLWKPDSD